MDATSGRVVVATSDDHGVNILDARTGNVLSTTALAQGASVDGLFTGAMATVVDARMGRAIVANGDANSVSVLDVRTGAVLRTIAVGVHPLDVAIDERTGHAFIVNYGGTVRAPAAWWERDVQRLHHWLPWLPQPFASTHLEPGSVSVLDTARL